MKIIIYQISEWCKKNVRLIKYLITSDFIVESLFNGELNISLREVALCNAFETALRSMFKRCSAFFRRPEIDKRLKSHIKCFI